MRVICCSGHRSITPYVHGLSYIAMCVLQASVELARKDLFESMAAWSLYSTWPGSYMQTVGPTGGPGVASTLLQR
jgi:hypothetical protein